MKPFILSNNSMLNDETIKLFKKKNNEKNLFKLSELANFMIMD